MSECTHCKGTGKCQDDFHTGATVFGGEDGSGRDRPSFLDNLAGECPSCGVWNTEMRPPCPHCDGSGGSTDWNLFSNSPLEQVVDVSARQSDATSNQESEVSSLLGSSPSTSDMSDKTVISISIFAFLFVPICYLGSSGYYLYLLYTGAFDGTLIGYIFGIILLPGMLFILFAWIILAGISSALGLNVIPM